MLYQTFIPGKPLSDFVTHFTYFKNYTPQHSIDRFLPNGNVEVVIDLTDEPKFIYDNDTLQEIQACKHLWVSGIRNHFITIPSGKHSELFVINFAKGLASPFLSMPLTEITDSVINGDLILHNCFLQLRAALIEHASPALKFSIAEKLLLKHFASRLEVNACVQYAVKQIVSTPEIVALADIKRKCGYSSKHLIQLFKNQVGVPPKTFLRIMRFQKAIAEIEATGQINWAGLAVGCGYFDQSHFIADFKSYSGFTPADYYSRKNGLLNYVPVG